MTTDELDEGVRRFVTEVTKAYAERRSEGPWSATAARQTAEAVREPWRAGGPAMHETTELLVPTPHGDVRVRLYRPTSAPAVPALIYMHGGGFTLFSIDTHDRLMREYAARTGMAVIGVDYALAPEARFPVALEQVVAVARWAAANAAVLGVDANRLAAGGDSAGANLALSAALLLRDAGEPRLLKALLLIYGGYGGGVSDEMEARYGGGRYMLNRDEARVFWSNYLADPALATDPLAAPFHAQLWGLPSCFMVIAEYDINAEQNVGMAGRLREAGVKVQAEIYKGATHSFLEAVSISAVANRAIEESSAWLRQNMGAGSE